MQLPKSVLVYLGLAVIFFMTASTASSRSFRVGVIPDKGLNFGCGTCHINPRGGGDRNVFGMDYARVGMKAGDKYTPELGAMDSDQDGFSNDEEFAAGTHPGDPSSKPAK